MQPAFGQVEVEEAFPNLWFDRPVDLQHAGDGTNRLFVLEQHEALVRVFPNEPGAESAGIFLDLSDRVRTNGGEEGLLRARFSPKLCVQWIRLRVLLRVFPASVCHRTVHGV